MSRTIRFKGKVERSLLSEAKAFVGVDEVGRGCLAGPVYAAAVMIDLDKVKKLPTKSRQLIRDSKTLSESQRSRAEDYIRSVAVEHVVAHATVAEIDEVGILKATFIAMRRCLTQLSRPFHVVLVDGNQKIPNIDWDQMSLVGGDSLCYSIAAASILAKNARDKMMIDIAAAYPHYGFENNVGYGTQHHLEALKKFGSCDLHRKNFAPVQAQRLSSDFAQLEGITF